MDRSWLGTFLAVAIVLVILCVVPTLIVVSVWSSDQTPRPDVNGICDDGDPTTLNQIVGTTNPSCHNPPIPSGSACESSPCFVDGECIVENGKPVGSSTGECPGIFYSIYPVECPIPIFLTDIQTDILASTLFYFRDCYLGLCRTQLMYPHNDIGYLLGMPPTGSEFTDIYVEVPDNEVFKARCMDLISDEDPRKGCMTAKIYSQFSSSFSTYFFICEYSYAGGHFRTLLDLGATDENLLPANVLSAIPPNLKDPSTIHKIESAYATRNPQSQGKQKNVGAAIISPNKVVTSAKKDTSAVSVFVREPTPEQDDEDTHVEKAPNDKFEEDSIEPVIPAPRKSKTPPAIQPKYKTARKDIHLSIREALGKFKKGGAFVPLRKRDGRFNGPTYRSGYEDRLKLLAKKFTESNARTESEEEEDTTSLNVVDLEQILILERHGFTGEDRQGISLEEIKSILPTFIGNPLKMQVDLNGSTPEFIINEVFSGTEAVEEFNDELAALAESGELTAMDIYYAFSSFFGSPVMGEFFGYMLESFLEWV